MTNDMDTTGPSYQYIDAGDEIEVGEWYWVDLWDEPRIGCVVHLGSNFAKLRGLSEVAETWRARVHFDKFWQICEPVDDPDVEINKRVQHHRASARKIMAKIRDKTQKLGVGSHEQLPGSETQALSTNVDRNHERYKKALKKAKDEELPELFDELEEHNESMGKWMKAHMIPMEAEAGQLRSVIGRINDRIYHVELYAGTSEEVVQIREGDRAAADERVVLYQRRRYMDEECLLKYEHGGMDFQNIGEFDEWIAKEDNFERLLPDPRCIVAFRVRREMKSRSSAVAPLFIDARHRPRHGQRGRRPALLRRYRRGRVRPASRTARRRLQPRPA